jgi:hypothetical protein
MIGCTKSISIIKTVIKTDINTNINTNLKNKEIKVEVSTTKSSGFARDFNIMSSENPIDKAFMKDFEIAAATP